MFLNPEKKLCWNSNGAISSNFISLVNISGFFALIDKEGNIRSRKDANGNPIIYYDGLEQPGIDMLKEDIKKLMEE